MAGNERKHSHEVSPVGSEDDLEDLAEIIESDERARSRFNWEFDEEIPREPTIEVPAELFAELAAYAGREWVVESPAMQEARRILKEASNDD